MYTSKHANIANAYKKWSGEMIGLKKSDAINKKQKIELDFLNTISNDLAKKDKYSNLFNELKTVYKEYAPLSKQYDYFTECLWGIDAFKFAASFVPVFNELKKKQLGKENKFDVMFKDLKPVLPFKNFNKRTDIKLCNTMLQEYIANVDREFMPRFLDSLLMVHNGNVKSLTDFLYNNSSFVDNEKAKIMFAEFEKSSSLYERDPLYLLSSSILLHYQKTVIPQISYYERHINELQKIYVKGLIENIKTKKFYPDANGTMRVSFGKVADYQPKDGVQYLHYTTIDGMVEKNKTGLEDFYVNPKLIELYDKKDFGQYVDKNGKLRIAFTGSNHTTGGNSGSPVINAKGELIGTNFDRNWEGTMSDVMYNGSFCRNIILDIRFTLWMVDKYAGAGYLLKEMKLVK
jgi:hypothetical protein